jgi:Rieske 2Fe-2S family protein
MEHRSAFHASSPILSFCPPTLPSSWYLSSLHFERELKEIHATSWIYVGRFNDLAPLTLYRRTVAGQQLLLLRDGDSVRCFHNFCRHRGAELCRSPNQRLKARLITCPYHEWAYGLDGELARIPHVIDTPGFDRKDHGLVKSHVKIWNGFVFVCLASEPPDFAGAPDLGIAALDHWPMEKLVTGHRLVQTLACNWKIFWENYNECLHCPGIHPTLCDMVPVYRKGVMSAPEAPGWKPTDPVKSPLREGARTWTVNGRPCGPEFPELTNEQRNAGFLFVTVMPSMFIVAHVDYVRAVSLRPVGTEETELTAEWLFPPETIAASGFDLANVVDFATTVMHEDGAACEMNQRGIRNSRYERGTLMPQEFDVYNFHQWLRRKLGEPLHHPEAIA